MKIAVFAADGAEGEALLGAAARLGEPTRFIEGPPNRSIGSRVRVHDLKATHYRNVLFEYDVVVYLLADSISGSFREALCEWPGIVVIPSDDVEPLFAGAPRLRRAVCERSLARVVYSRPLAQRLLEDNPWLPVFVVAEPAGEAEIAAAIAQAVAHRASHAWLRTLLESACVDLPCFVPADRFAPWRGELDELAELVEPSRLK